MSYQNEMHLQFPARSENESFARVTVASFISQLDPTVDEMSDIKTVVSEAVTNAIIHGYEENELCMVHVQTQILNGEVTIIVRDEGKGMTDIDQARQPLYTSKPELERTGMGFTIMENFMDSVEVDSKEGEGTTVVLRKKISMNQALCN